MLTAKDIKYLRLRRGLENAYMLLADLDARPYTWLNECLLARQKQIVKYREYKLKSFEERNGLCSR